MYKNDPKIFCSKNFIMGYQKTQILKLNLNVWNCVHENVPKIGSEKPKTFAKSAKSGKIKICTVFTCNFLPEHLFEPISTNLKPA
jgi:hypothetical protein